MLGVDGKTVATVRAELEGTAGFRTWTRRSARMARPPGRQATGELVCGASNCPGPTVHASRDGGENAERRRYYRTANLQTESSIAEANIARSQVITTPLGLAETLIGARNRGCDTTEGRIELRALTVLPLKWIGPPIAPAFATRVCRLLSAIPINSYDFEGASFVGADAEVAHEPPVGRGHFGCSQFVVFCFFLSSLLLAHRFCKIWCFIKISFFGDLLCGNVLASRLFATKSVCFGGDVGNFPTYLSFLADGLDRLVVHTQRRRNLTVTSFRCSL